MLLHRDKKLRSDQTFVTDNWLGGVYGSSGILGTKSGGPIASAWAIMQYLGDDGYQRVTRSARTSALTIADHINKIPELTLRAQPDTTLLCFGASDPFRHDIFGLSQSLIERGWFMDQQTPPPSIHLTVNAIHENHIEAFLADLDACLPALSTAGGSAGNYGTIE